MKLVEHLRLRGMDPKLYRVSYNYNTSIITFLLYNLSGQVVGYQHYRPNVSDKGIKNNPKLGRYFTYLPRGTIGVFGLESLAFSERTLFVTEGIFKAATLHRLGYSAIAVLTANPAQMRGWFTALGGARRVIGVGDGDKAGGELVRTVGAGFCTFTDLDEMPDQDIKNLIEYL